MDKENNELDYANYIKDKRVIFVGPSPILMDKYMGDYIDSYDIVVRTNGSIFLLDNEDFKLHYGSKCNVLYSNVQFHREMKPFPVSKWKENHNLDFINFKSIQQRYQIDYNTKIKTREIKYLIGELAQEIKGLLMGPLLLADILQFNPKELFFTGMDFYIDKPDIFIPNDYREYYPGYLPKKIVDKADIANINRVDPHDQYSNCAYIYKLLIEEKIKTDNTTKIIMDKILNNPNYYSYKGKMERLSNG